MPQLDALSLQELHDLCLHLRLLGAVGETLHDNGLTPIFGLVPGQCATIVLPMVMPPICQYPVAAVMDAASLPSALNQAADDAPPAAGVQTTAGVDASEDPFPSEPDHMPTSSREDVRTDSAAVPGAEAPVLPADCPQPVEKARAWTPDEDARLVQWVAEKMRAGSSKAAAICVVAADLDRPEQGTEYRLKNKLKDALAAALAATRIVVPKQTSPQVGDGSPVGGGAVIGSAAQAPADATAPRLALVPDGLAAYLATLSRKHFTLAQDEQLMDLATSGWGIPEIASEMQIDPRAVRDRWDLLTGLTRDDDGKQRRRFKAEAVQKHLSMLLTGRG